MKYCSNDVTTRRECVRRAECQLCDVVVADSGPCCHDDHDHDDDDDDDVEDDDSGGGDVAVMVRRAARGRCLHTTRPSTARCLFPLRLHSAPNITQNIVVINLRLTPRLSADKPLRPDFLAHSANGTKTGAETLERR